MLAFWEILRTCYTDDPKPKLKANFESMAFEEYFRIECGE